MRIAIIGAGAIGGYLATQLQRVGHDVTVVTRPEYVDPINRDGLSLRIRGQTKATRVRAVDRLSQPPDLLFLTVKTQNLTGACQAALPAAKGVTAVTLQNGVRADAIASSILDPETIVGGIAMCAVTCLQPGTVSVDVAGWFIVGQPSGATNGRVATVARTLGQVTPTFITPNLAGARWSKLIGNLTNGLSAATGYSLAELARHPLGRQLAIKLMREGHQVVRAAGIKVDRHLYGFEPLRGDVRLLALLQALVTNLLPVLPEEASAQILSLAGRSSLSHVDFRGSTWQSLARGRRTEIDYLNGEIVRLGREVGVPTPCNARILDAVHTAERSKRNVPIREIWPEAA